MGTFDFNMPVKIISGENCVKTHSDIFNLGKCALICTGKHSAIKSGALDDVKAVLESIGIKYTIFDKIFENPLLSITYEGGKLARDFDFVIGIGGGSAIDASKAIAAFGANPSIKGEAIFTDADKPSLPLIAIPTTSGTGSEANNYAILSLDGKNKKKTFKNAYSYPDIAFLDPRYTYSLDAHYTVSTALDAFAHALESYLSPKSTDISRMMSVYAAKNIWAVIKTNHESYTPAERAMLQNASCAAGIAINTTGTGFPHPMGYNLTMFHGIPHGAACAVFERKFIEYSSKSTDGKVLVDEFAKKCGFDIDIVTDRLYELADINYKADEAEIELFVNTTASASNYANNHYVISVDEMKQIYRDVLC